VVARAKTGSGKTLAYLLPLLQKLFSADSVSKKKPAPSAFILVPSRELCQQVCFGPLFHISPTFTDFNN